MTVNILSSCLLLVITTVLLVCVIFFKVNFKIPNTKVQSQSVLAESLCEAEYSCASCSQVRICRSNQGRFQEVFRLSCGGNTPYCDPVRGSCSDVLPQGCENIGVFRCMHDGVFPDPTDCKAYHVCEHGTSHTFQCLGGKSFDGVSCGDSSCQCINCNGKSGIKVPHPLNSSTYAYCLNNKPLFMDVCPPGKKMYAAQQQCLDACSMSEENIPDPSDCTKYFKCSVEPNSSLKYTLTNQSCSAGQQFDPASKSCGRISVSCVHPRNKDLPMVITVYH